MTVTSVDDTRRPNSEWLLQFLQHLPAASAVIGGAAYVFVRIVLNEFYSAFGVTPEEVGWNATTVLTRFALPLAIVLLLALLLVAKAHEDKLIRTGFVSVLTTGASRFTFPVIAMGLSVALLVFAHGRIGILRRGIPLSASLDTMVPISAPCVHAFWIDAPEAPAALPAFDAGQKLFLLGEGAGTTVLYDATADASLRVPTARIVLKSCAP
jgi:hypothetical protein